MPRPRLPKVDVKRRTCRWDAIPQASRARFLNPGEMDVLAELLAGSRRVVEVGCQNGRTARVLLDTLPEIERYVGIDVLPGYVPEKAVQRGEVPANPGEFALADPRFQLIVRPRGAFDLDGLDVGHADAFFIDGDHSRAGVANDYVLARACLTKGGLVIFHDYHHLAHPDGTPQVDVATVLEEMAADGHRITHVAGTWIAFERV